MADRLYRLRWIDRATFRRNSRQVLRKNWGFRLWWRSSHTSSDGNARIFVEHCNPTLLEQNRLANSMGIIQIHVFISHSWSYSGHYDKLASWIFGQSWSVGSTSLDLRNYSVPKTDPILNARNDTQLKTAIYNQMSRSHVIVIPTGMYTHHSKWIRKEIDGASFYGKPILAVDPWGALKSASVVASAAHKTVGWNSKSVVNGIWELYRS